MIALSAFYDNNSISVKQFNSTTAVLTAAVLFIVLYKSNVKNFINKEMLKEDKETSIKLFEINPFPLMIVRFRDGKIQYVNHRAMVFYEIQQDQLGALYHRDFYANESDVAVIYRMLETGGVLSNYVVEQKTVSGETRRSIVNYELIDYFGEKSVLIGVADIAEIKRMEHELTIHASVDTQTGVFKQKSGHGTCEKTV